MNIAELKKEIEDNVQSGTLTLNASTLGSPNVQLIIDAYFSDKTVIMSDVTLNISDTEVTVGGKIKFFTNSNIPATIVFSINNSEAELKLTVPLPSSWTFSECSASIKNGYLNNLTFSNAQFTLLSDNQITPVILNKGLSFQGLISDGLPGFLSALLQSPVTLEGTIDLEKNGPKIDLWLTPGTSLDFGSLKLPAVYSGITTFPTPSISGSQIGRCYQMIQFKSKIPIAGESLSISGCYSDFNKLLLIETTNQSLSLSDGLKSIFDLIGWIPEITWPSDTFLSDIYLTNIRLLAQFEPTSLHSLSFGIECKTDWSFIPDKVVLEKIAIGIWINDPLNIQGKQYGGQIYGQFLIGTDSGAILDLYAQMPPSGMQQGWDFSGSTQPGTVLEIGSVISDLCSKFSITLPDALQNFTLKDLYVGFKDSSSDFNVFFTVDFEIDNKKVEIGINVSITKSGKTYSRVINGNLLIGTSLFDVTFSDEPGVETFQASWSDSANPLEFSDIASTFGFTPPTIPAGLDLALKSASLTYDFTKSVLVMEASSANYGNAVFVAYKNPKTSEWQFYFGLSIGISINLSNLPLIDKVLSDQEKIEIRNLQVLVSSTPLLSTNPDDLAEISLINSFISQGYPTIPAQGLPGTIAISAQFDFGGLIIPLSIGTPAKTIQVGQSTGALPSTGGSSVGPGSGTNPGSVPQPTQSADGATWFNIQKSFGPVSFQKVGVKYEEGVLWLLIDAGITAAGLGISVIGLSMGLPLTTFQPEFNIEGLGVAYSNPTLTISGAFEKLSPKAPVTLQFAGTVTVQLKEFGISAMGAYAQFDSQTSMFVFANIDGSFGGPGFFFITGFCGGFGYNSKLRVPGQEEVYPFPFVASMSDPSVFGANPSPTTVLQEIMGGVNPWVTPSVGDIWMSAGIKFTTYKVVNSTALIVAEFGNKFLLSLIGLSRARFPMEGPTVYAYVELQLEAIFDPSEGVASFTAVLSPNSYVLDKACHLTGGFALCYWFGPSPYAGDFVLTLGGYSPYFTPPSYYPQEPLLGFSWALDSSISISGGLYFAMTPAAVMAGGNLSAVYHSGNLKAWFDMYADIIIWYNPFHFIADIGINIGASYKVDLLFCSKTFSAELGADLMLWGPPTGGMVTIHWFIISFTVDFGADLSTGLDKQIWNDFIKVLPAPNDVVKITLLKGLLEGPVPADSGDGLTVSSDAQQIWVVRADSFQFTTNSSVPLSELCIGTDTTPVKTGSPLNIKPMQSTGLSAKKTLAIVSKETGNNVLNSTWDIEFINSNVPSALWGTGSSKELPSGPQLVANQLTGFQIKVPSPSLGSGTGDINIKEDLQYDPLTPGVSPLKLGLDAQGPVPAASDATIADIEQIMSVSIKSQRDGIYKTFEALGLDGLTNADLTGLAQNTGALFVDEPLLINS